MINKKYYYPELIKYTIIVEEPLFSKQCQGSGTYIAGSSTVIEAPADFTLDGVQWKFWKWNDGNTNRTRTVTVTQNQTYSAWMCANDRWLLTINNSLQGATIYYSSLDSSGNEHTVSTQAVTDIFFSNISINNYNNIIKFKVNYSGSYNFTIKDTQDNTIPYTFDGEYNVINWSYSANNHIIITVT